METPKAPDTPGDDERAAIDADAALREAEAFDPGEELVRRLPRRGARRAGSPARPPSSRSPPRASRVAGLGREVVAAGYYGISGPMSAFTIAFQVPNLIRALFADAALQPAFVPVFTELIGKKHYKEAFRLASTLLLLVTMVLGAITALFVLFAPVVMPLFAPGFKGEILDLTVTLSQVLFPILILLGVSGVVVGILNSYDRFGAFAISPLFWNLTIILVLVVLEPLFHGQDRIYAYAIGILVGTLVQLLIPAWDLRNTPFHFSFSFDWRHPGLRRVLLLMLPVTISLGLINFNLLINSFFGSLVSDQAPAAIDKAFRIYQLPQGIFSVAIATVLFPTLARFANARRDRQPAGDDGQRDAPDPLRPAAGRRRDPRPLGPDDPARLPARRLQPGGDGGGGDGALLVRLLAADQRRSTCCRRAPSSACSAPGRRPRLAVIDLVVSAVAALALYKPFGVGGIVAGTGIGTSAAVVAQAVILRREFGGLELGRLFSTASRITIASAALAGVSWLVWDVLDEALGRGLVGQIISLGAGLAIGGLVYLAVRQAAADRRARADHAPAAAPLDARARPLPARRRRARPARRLRLAGRGRCARRLLPRVPRSAGALATR